MTHSRPVYRRSWVVQRLFRGRAAMAIDVFAMAGPARLMQSETPQ